VNYRPVSLLPVVSKIIEKVVHRQLMEYIEEHADLGFLPAEQFAYRHQHSCEDCLTLGISRWTAALDRGEHCGVVLLDMSKAFDRVKHDLLLAELRAIGIQGVPLAWFANYLTDRRQQVRVSASYGDITSCTRGVPQGSVLGPLLFSLYVRHVPHTLRNSQCQQFADDIAFYASSVNLSDVTSRLTTDINTIERYLDSIGLLLNPAKTRFLLLCKRTTTLPADLAIRCNDTVIPVTDSARYLGLIIDRHLSFKDHIDHVSVNVYRKLRAFTRCRNDVPHAAKRVFYLSIIQSTIDYASNAYVHSLTTSQYSRLVTLSHIAMKKVFSLSRMTSTDFVLRHASLYSLEARFNLKLFVFVYRCVHALTSPRQTRGQSLSSLSLPPVLSRYGMFSIRFLAADRWNSLPRECRTAESLPVFVTLCKQFLGFPVRRRQRL